MEIHWTWTTSCPSCVEREGGSLEKKVAEKIAEVLNRQMEHEHEDGKGEGGGEGKVQTPEDVAKMYQRLMAAVSGSEEKRQGRREGEGRE